jgi:glycosyltransferase involved in cell wall biosynthesis
MRFCEAVAANGADVEVVSLGVQLDFDEPTRSRDLFEVYGINVPFRVTVLPSRMSQMHREKVSGLWRAFLYGAYASWRLIARPDAFGKDVTIFYFKNYLIALPLLLLRCITRHRLLLLFEIHGPPRRRGDKAVLRRLDGVISLSEALAHHLKHEVGLEPTRILQAHQGVNLNYVERIRVSKTEARRALALPSDKRLVVYTGKVHSWSREVSFLIDAVELLPSDVELVVVGGRGDHVERLRERLTQQGIQRVRLVGFVAPAEVFRYQFAADVLVSYYPSDIGNLEYLSPGKLFEYMASNRPIVTADHAFLREILNNDAAVFVERDRPYELAQGIRMVLDNEVIGLQIAANAYRDVQRFTWQKRAERILAFSRELRTASRVSRSRGGLWERERA